ncbi:MAG TPA: HAD hydrolase-like protein [Polyangiaceae bacterium LLY-WYZ-15_(1-7)]|mgnify:CR=1 FL=1|nr:haloacid dehalogenase [Myxococcales bacterium]MAT29862.1 haloacid dehalogenase [Sandaracinus sp.]HJL01134.1 HAD hydrolase-like protein [Polyangiaceae bacterium LLY-WYZ-15_(1-7)]MBJ73618.1 haloacid dehalogenase [Sandaracinus sp.]HJL09985.1 HAD hydrolase-like protein [Polyangiaceae bacterium LLY-WYZ-15_(1-7)]
MQPSVLLFDVDGTLVNTGGAGRRAMAQAFGEVTGDATALDRIELGGMTDRLILREGLRAIGRPFEEALFERIIAVYLGHLAEELPRSEGYEVLPGVLEVVEALAVAGAHLALGLGTGNVEKGAFLKLSRAGLDTRFAFGGFGDDAEDRGELIRHGAERGAAALGQPLEACRVVVIGDTPRDVSAAAAIGATCVAVATGGHGADVLREAGAPHVVENLRDPRAMQVILGE